MQMHFPENLLECLPLAVGSGDSAEGARLGGAPPNQLFPSRKTIDTRYFATFPLVPGGEHEVSIFLAFTFDQMADASGRILGPSDDLIEVLVHEKTPRGSQTGELISELSAHPLIIHKPSPDWFVSGGEKVIESGHKLGGRPYIDY